MCFFISKEYQKTFHITNSMTNARICDVQLVTVHRMSSGATMSVKVDNNTALMKGQTTKNCCGEVHQIKENMPITIQYSSISQLFEQHSCQFVLDMAPIWDKPLSRLHLYIDGKNVVDPSRPVTEFTNSDYLTGPRCAWWGLFWLMTIVFTLIYTFIGMLFLGV